MSELNGVNGSSRRGWDGREPIFRDVPFERSEWAGVYAVLKQVNQLKAELAHAQYEATRTAYQNYLKAYEQELAAYAQRRREDEAYNREAYEQRRLIAEKIEAIRQRWQQEIDRLLEELNSADVEAYRRAGLAGINLRGDPLLGIGLPEELEGRAAERDATDSDGTADASLADSGTQGTAAAHASFTAQVSRSQPALDASLIDSADSPEPLTPEEAAHDACLPTNQSLVIPHWLHWAAPVLIGLAIGQILLVALGRPIGDWESLAFWIASLAGVMSTLLWYRVVWGLSRAVSELYYLFDWGAAKARRAAWLGGFALMLLAISPLALLAFTLSQLPAVWTRDSQLLTALTLLLMLPLLGLALVGGYLQGREQVVRNAVQSAVVAAKRNQLQEAREQARQERIQREQIRLEQERERTEGNNAPHNGAPPPPVAVLPPAPSSNDPHQRLRDAFEAISYARGVYANYRRARELMQEELALYEQMVRDLQPRPIYDYLPPQAEQRIQTLYNQWRDAYGAFLDYIAEATRECKDSEQIQQRIADFKRALMG